jgi:hypothetical protein
MISNWLLMCRTVSVLKYKGPFRDKTAPGTLNESTVVHFWYVLETRL